MERLEERPVERLAERLEERLRGEATGEAVWLCGCVYFIHSSLPSICFQRLRGCDVNRQSNFRDRFFFKFLGIRVRG